MFKIKALLPALFFALTAQSVNAQEQKSKENYNQYYLDSVTASLNQYLNTSQVPGYSVVLLNKDGIMYQGGFGYANIGTKELYTPSTIENIGSVSKTFISVALMKAVEMNLISLNTNINNILPFKVINPNHPEDSILVKDLTNHTSGIVDNELVYNSSYFFEKKPDLDTALVSIMKKMGYTSALPKMSLADFMKEYLSPQGKLYSAKNFSNAKRGQHASYSNIGSALVAYLIEIESGMPFDEFSEKYILKPLNMQQTSWYLIKDYMKQYATPYFTRKMPLPLYSLTTYPDGGLRTSALELANYVHEMMNSLNDHPKILKEETVEAMFTPFFTSETVPSGMNLNTRNKGVFWNLYNDGYIGHDGDDPGVSTNILFNKGLGIIFMTNIYKDDRNNILEMLKKYGEEMVKGGIGDLKGRKFGK
jgi:CubicO group peptidase (beta-lactamase class C family)